MKVYESAESSMLHEVGAISHDEGGGVFSAVLQCANKDCSEHVVFAGFAYPGEDEHPDGSPYTAWFLRPEHFTPAIALFRISDSVPKDIAEATTSSFRLFWADSSAAGNALRTALELLLDKKGIPRFSTGGGKPLGIALHDRIVMFQKQEPAIANLLLATKWIGNEGSHSMSLDRKGVLSAYELLSLVFEELFDQRTSRLTDLANRINQNRGAV